MGVSWNFCRNLSSTESKRNLFVLVEPSLLHHTFLLGPARFTALHIKRPDPHCSQNPRIRSIYGKNPQSARFLRPNPSIRKPIHRAVASNRQTEALASVVFFVFFVLSHQKHSCHNSILGHCLSNNLFLATALIHPPLQCESGCWL